MLALINNILDLATIDAGRMQLNLGPVDILETMAAAAEGVQDRLVSAGLALDISAPADIGSFIADKLRLRQILFNLLANAVSFSPGGATVTLSAARTAGAVVFSVTDQGPGIPPHVLEKVFDWFETHSLGIAASRAGDRAFPGPLLRRAAWRHGDDHFGRGTRHHRDMYIPAH